MESTTKLNSKIGQSLWAYLQLMRPANIITAWADILAGFAAAGAVAADGGQSLILLLVATTGLYGGGVVFNDVFDAELDKLERPERPIPSGRASRGGAVVLGSLLLVVGVVSAAWVSWLSMAIAITVALLALVYDAVSKHNVLAGPINMGCCRGGNLLLGASVMPAMLVERWWIALFPIVYIGAITAISQGEVRGGKRATGVLALACLGLVLGGILAMGIWSDYAILTGLPFLVLLAGRTLPPFIKATRDPAAETIRLAVRAGVLSLIVLDATLAAGFTGWVYGLAILSLLPLSAAIARRLAVT